MYISDVLKRLETGYDIKGFVDIILLIEINELKVIAWKFLPCLNEILGMVETGRCPGGYFF